MSRKYIIDDTPVGRHYGKIDIERVGNMYSDKGICVCSAIIDFVNVKKVF